MFRTKIVIIGAGIAGVSAAIYLKLLNIDFVLIESGSVGGKLDNIKNIQNFPTYKNINGSDLASNLLKQLNYHNIKITNGNVQTILMQKDGFEVISDIDSYICDSVIVCSGTNINNSLIKGEKEYFQKGVSYCAICDANFFRNKDVAVVGNNNVALEESLYLSNIVKHVFLFTSSSELNGDSNLINKIKSNKNIDVIDNCEVNSINGNGNYVESISTNKGDFNVSAVFPYIGKKNYLEFLSNLNVEILNNYVLTNENRETNVPGIFAAGDIVYKNLRQLVTAASDGAIAAANSVKYIK